MARGTILILFVILAACQGGGQEETNIGKAEGALALPQRAYPISGYNRYYIIENKTADGIFIYADGKEGKLSLVRTRKEMPFVADGGCYVVHVRLNLNTKKWERPFCNGTS